jgi:RND family efflux transporter MFP subunit
MSVPAKLKLIDEDTFSHEGRIDFVDNAIDRSSGTIRGRAQFKNPDGRLTPGMFGRIQISVSEPVQALLVPDSAIATEQVRKFVYVISKDNIATPKYVTLGPLVDGQRVIASGLDAEDLVVVNGLMRVRPGAKVVPERADAGDGKETVVGTN